MIKFVKNIEVFWRQELANHSYVRQVPFVSKNFDHLDRSFYNKDFLLQSFNEEMPLFQEFKNVFSLTQASVSWTCILPNVILPSHRDTFYTLRQQHDVSVEKCFRYLIFLEDWVFGHYVGFENVNITHWKAGDTWSFDSTENHFGVNASNVPFHSCQLSSFN